MFNQKLKALLERFLHNKDSSEIETFFEEQTKSWATNLTRDLEPTILEVTETGPPVSPEETMPMYEPQSQSFSPPETKKTSDSISSHRYRMVKKLGQGGMGAVWQMKDNQLLRTIAMKQLLSTKADSNFLKESFFVEAQITAQLQHPGIVPIYDLQLDEAGNMFFIMREIIGCEFAKIIKEVHQASKKQWRTTKEGWNLRRLVETIGKICQTLAYAHMRGVIHQDLKPANIMLGDYGEVLIVDWGVAFVRSLYQENENWIKIKASQEYIRYKKGAASGTPRYMPLEQFLGDYRKINAHSDVYALGIILFCILTKSKPYSGSIDDVFKQKMKDKLSIRQWIKDNPDALPIPKELVEICEKAIAHHPKDRFQDTQEMQRAIQAWLDGSKQEEEARKIIKEIDETLGSIKELEALANSILPQLNVPSSQAKELSEEWWLNWVSLQDIREKIDSMRDIIYQKAQGAILYAPHLTEIYDRLIELEYQDYSEAITEGNFRGVSKIGRRLEVYLTNLPIAEQERWKNIQTIDLTVRQFQKNHGVNIERVYEIQAMEECLEKQNWVSIAGLAGVGKTHLAWQVAAKWCKDNNWTIYFSDVTDCITAASLLQSLAEALDISPTDADPLDLIIRLLNTPTIEGSFLIIDNAEHLDKQSIEILHTIVQRCPNIRMITTSRKSLGHENEHIYSLSPMSLIDGIELFVQHCKYQLSDWSLTTNNRQLVLEIVNALDKIPLAIELAGSRIAEFSLTELLNRLDKRFNLLHSKNDIESPLQLAISWSFSELSDLERQVLRQLSVLRTEFSLSLAEAIIALPEEQSLATILDTLTQQNLISRERRENKTIYTILKSIRDFALQQAKPEFIQKTEHRIAEYLGEQLKQNPEAVLPLPLLRIGALFGPSKEASICCTHFLKYIEDYGPISMGIELADQFLQRRDVERLDKRPIRLLEIDLLLIQGVSKKLLKKLRMISAEKPDSFIEAPTELSEAAVSAFYDSPPPTSSSISQLHSKYNALAQKHLWSEALTCAVQIFQLGSVEEKINILERSIADQTHGGHLQQALGIALHLEEILLSLQRDSLSTIVNIAVLYTRLGNQEKSIRRYNQALQLAESIEDTEQQARIIGNLGLLYQSLGDLEQATAQYKQAQTLFQKLGNLDKLSALEGNLGTILQEQEQYPQAIEHFNTAIEQARAVHNSINEGVFLGNRALCLIKLNQAQQAKQDLKQAIVICDQQLEFAAGAFRGELANILSQEGSLREAKKLFKKGEPQVKEHREQYGKFLCRKALFLHTIHDWDGVKTTLHQVEEISKELDLSATSALRKELVATQKQIPPSIWLSQEEIDERRFIADVLLRWGKYEQDLTRYPQALHYYQQAIPIYELLQEKKILLSIDLLITKIYSQTGKKQEAIRIIKIIRQKHRQSGDILSYAEATDLLGFYLKTMGQADEALQCHQETIRIYSELKSRSLAKSLDYAGRSHRILGNYQQALEYYQRALDIYKQNNRPLGDIYTSIGISYAAQGDEDKALEFLHLALKDIHHQYGENTNRKGTALNSIATIYWRQKRYPEAEAIFQKLIQISLQTESPVNECLSRGNYSFVLTNMERYDEAAEQALRAIELAKTTTVLLEWLFTSYLANIRSLQQKHTEAIEIFGRIDLEAAVSNVEIYTTLLCLATNIHHRAGNPEQASDNVSQIRQLFEKHQFSEKSNVAQYWSDTKQLLELKD